MCSVIPTDGFGTIMGRSFKRWRTTGSVKYSVQFFGARNVDKIFLLVVCAGLRRRTASEN